MPGASKVNVAQTATHAAAVLTSAVIGAKGLPTEGEVGEQVLNAFRSYREAIMGDLESYREDEEKEKVANASSEVVPSRYKKHAGKTWEQVLSEDEPYLHWLATSGSNKEDASFAAELLKSKGKTPTKGFKG